MLARKVSEMARLRTCGVMAATCCVAMCCAILPAVSVASSAPLIGSTSAEVSQNDATLQAPISPDGLETTYELWLEYPACQSGDTCSPTSRERVGEGSIPANRLEQVVSAGLTSLKWEYSYNFVVIASNSDGTRQSYPLTFTTGSSPPPGLPNGSGGQPAKFEDAPWNLGGAERVASEAPRLEEEREAKKKEGEERPAKEAAAHAAKEREIREAGERTGREAAERALKETAISGCVVPRLKGDSLTATRHVLAKDHCRLGKVSKPHKYRGALVVMKQSAKAGTKLTNGAVVAVKLGPASKKR